MSVLEVQQALKDLGYDPGSIDGIWGSRSASACADFQRSRGLTADGVPGPNTQTALMEALRSTPEPFRPAPLPLPPILSHAEEMGFKVWGDPWRLWFFGVRSPNRTAGTFDDALGVFWTENDSLWRCEWWRGTTDPGRFYMQEPMNSRGCAILVTGQYLDSWIIGEHSGSYEALCQSSDVRVYRDADRDAVLDLDPSTIQQGKYGINIHASTRQQDAQLQTVGKYSAGCQVHATEAGFSRMMELAHLQIQNTGRQTFSYTLFDRWW